MIDTLIILLVTGAVMFVVVRAIQLDARQPWFRPRTARPVARPKTPEDWE